MADGWVLDQTSSKGLRAIEPEMIGGGFALPKSFTAKAHRGDVQVEVDAEVDAKGKVWAREVRVRSEARRGVTSNTVRDAPIREIAAKAAASRLLRITRSGSGWEAKPISKVGPAELAVVRDAVGYVKGKKR